jgi:ectoine hydroxylase-related dioxygenase (phytanoyl-CoA dioxygenase family)
VLAGHQDNGYAYIDPQHYLTCWVALTDATVETGCPWVVPYAHRLGTLSHSWNATMHGWEVDGLRDFLGSGADGLPKSSAAECCEVLAGDIVVFSSLTPHMTGPQHAEGFVRKAYILQFIADGAEYISLPNGQQLSGSPRDPKRQYFVLDEHAQQHKQEESEQQQRQQAKKSADAIRTLAHKGPKL